ncbi:GNAT family N-acetyltransferase [Bacillus gobiensis]|uniref:GNAT family N-acetyltransferase n=1 Tax=Bacillus gobiensis TaxID=1441095 RepID=UPI003D1E8E1C
MQRIERDLGNGFLISTDKQKLNIELIHTFLSEESYWAKDIKREAVVKLILNSPLCYGIYEASTGNQAGFARVVTDFVKFSWLADVFVLPEYRGHSLGKKLIQTIVSHPELEGCRFMLATKDAHGLYEKYGFSSLENSEDFLMRPMDMKIVEKAL